MDVDTIVALSTPPGVGAIALVRLSGPEAAGILRTVAPDTGPLEPRRPTLAEIRDPDDGRVVDRALVTLFAAPASYTGEDLVEISCHGGWLTPRMVIDACRRAGAREAEPGEFTKRAYLRGKLDLVQAEAIADLIEARSRALHEAALGQLERGLSRRVSELRERLVSLEARLAHHVDFPEEDDAPVPLGDVMAGADELVEELDRMLATAPEGELLREGAMAVFAGRPNVGKSSLYNALVGEERAIVTEEAGTTRDALETTVQLGGFPFRLVDTAGLRESSARIERLGIEVAHRYLDRADVILFCVECRERLLEADRAFLGERRSTPIVLVETKADLAGDGEPTAGGDERPADASGRGASPGAGPDGAGGATGDRAGGASPVVVSGREIAGRVRVSVETGQGLDQLRQLLPELVYAAVVSAGSDSPVLTRRRHALALESARDEIASFRAGLGEGLPAEVAATHLRSAETALEELLGVVSVDDVLDVVFREFCIGK